MSLPREILECLLSSVQYESKICTLLNSVLTLKLIAGLKKQTPTYLSTGDQ
jgi:hypothetical protein